MRKVAVQEKSSPQTSGIPLRPNTNPLDTNCVRNRKLLQSLSRGYRGEGLVRTSSNCKQQTRPTHRIKKGKSNRRSKQAVVVVKSINYLLLIPTTLRTHPRLKQRNKKAGRASRLDLPDVGRFRARFPKPTRLLLTIPTAAAKTTDRESVNVRSQSVRETQTCN